MVLEAQASGLPVIVSDAGGPRELMLDGETGLVFRAGNADDLASAIERIAANPLLHGDMARRARLFVLEKGPDAAETYSTILHRPSKSDEADLSPATYTV